MPDPHDNTKMTGDIHPPDVEPDLDSPGAAGTRRGATARRVRAARTVGAAQEPRDETSDSEGGGRDSGESPEENRS